MKHSFALLLPSLAMAALLGSGCATTFSRTTSRGDLSIPVALRAVVGGHARDVMVTEAEVRVAPDGFPRLKAHLLYTHIWGGQAVSSQPFKWKFFWRDPSGRKCAGKEGMQGGRIDTRNGLDAKSVSPVKNPTGVVIDIDTGYVTISSLTRKPMPSVTDLFSHNEAPRGPLNDPLDPWLHPPEPEFLSGTAVVTNIVVTDFDEDPEPTEPAPYDIVTVKPYKDGAAVFRVTIRDDSVREQDVLAAARSEIERTVHESFSAEHPEDDGDDSPVSISIKRLETKDGSRAFRMAGKVVSPKSDIEGWDYDADARRGTIRFRVRSHADAKTVKAWAARHIAAIVEDKGVAVEVGMAPPPGAHYRMTEDHFEDGILLVSFEIVP